MVDLDPTDTPPCPDCGGQLAEHGPDDDSSSANAYDCPLCGWGLLDCDEPLTVASAPWTAEVWAEVEIARRLHQHGAPTPAQLTELTRLGWVPGESNPVTWAVARIGLLTADLAEIFLLCSADPDGAPDWKIAPAALREVRQLHKEYDELLDARNRLRAALAAYEAAYRAASGVPNE